MGNNLDAYRAAIGLFHACKMSLNIGYDSRSDTFHDIVIRWPLIIPSINYIDSTCVKGQLKETFIL